MRLNYLLLAGVGVLLTGFSVTAPQASSSKAVAMAPHAPVAAAALVAPAVVAPVAAAPAAAEVAGNSRADLVETALSRLERHVRRKSHPEALRTAFNAYYSYKQRHPGQVRKPYLYYVDFGLDNRTARGYVFDMDRMTLVEGPFTVAHGSGSSNGKNSTPSRFSNTPGSKMTSLGLYRAQETYRFSGKSGGRAYTSVGMRMAGVSGRFNSNARKRGIVAHGAPYVTASIAGRSEGCPAMEQARARRLLPKIANGGMVFHFSPRDSNWMKNDPWING